ncbi:bifunctional UDP-N-acetylglucosamine diphosphorylase/glucosamine-1-phosphate N-acetyltransferase GlmU [Alicyclobacillaceae bacterium I2511]|nr:bifunctional UDP-N-acetylglucosamine diphosphorylase/glucosamine-1-phosphate N-acetyltransferase GlmU [Alicyclobacillaceae bacterium I2511]
MGRSAIVLAAGLGTRMKSKQPKVMHPVCGKPMISHILDELQLLGLEQVVVVVGPQQDEVAAVVGQRAQLAVQDRQLGTGHAVMAALPYLRADSETVVVLYGDAPLVRAQTVNRLLEAKTLPQVAACVLTARVADPRGLGRVIMGVADRVVRIVEEKDATPEEEAIDLINTGIYAFATPLLKMALQNLHPDNAQGEYYLTDTLSYLANNVGQVLGVEVADPREIASVNDRVQLAYVEHLMRERLWQYWALQGVTIVDPEHTYIGADVKIGQDTVLMPGSLLEGNTVIGEDCVIGPESRLVNARVASGARIEKSVVLDSFVDVGARVGPFAYVRPGSEIGPEARIGDFVEIKNTRVGTGTKISHLAYVGDADVGEGVNVGCGVITVNYDGERKHHTVIGNGSFVGSNVNLIAPVRVGAGAYVTAGSTITDDVPEDAFAIARSRQVTKENYVKAWKSHRATEKLEKGEQ